MGVGVAVDVEAEVGMGVGVSVEAEVGVDVGVGVATGVGVGVSVGPGACVFADSGCEPGVIGVELRIGVAERPPHAAMARVDSTMKRANMNEWSRTSIS